MPTDPKERLRLMMGGEDQKRSEPLSVPKGGRDPRARMEKMQARQTEVEDAATTAPHELSPPSNLGLDWLVEPGTTPPVQNFEYEPSPMVKALHVPRPPQTPPLGDYGLAEKPFADRAKDFLFPEDRRPVEQADGLLVDPTLGVPIAGQVFNTETGRYEARMSPLEARGAARGIGLIPAGFNMGVVGGTWLGNKVRAWSGKDVPLDVDPDLLMNWEQDTLMGWFVFGDAAFDPTKDPFTSVPEDELFHFGSEGSRKFGREILNRLYRGLYNITGNEEYLRHMVTMANVPKDPEVDYVPAGWGGMFGSVMSQYARMNYTTGRYVYNNARAQFGADVPVQDRQWHDLWVENANMPVWAEIALSPDVLTGVGQASVTSAKLANTISRKTAQYSRRTIFNMMRRGPTNTPAARTIAQIMSEAGGAKFTKEGFQQSIDVLYDGLSTRERVALTQVSDTALNNYLDGVLTIKQLPKEVRKLAKQIEATEIPNNIKSITFLGVAQKARELGPMRIMDYHLMEGLGEAEVALRRLEGFRESIRGTMQEGTISQPQSMVLGEISEAVAEMEKAAGRSKLKNDPELIHLIEDVHKRQQAGGPAPQLVDAQRAVPHASHEQAMAVLMDSMNFMTDPAKRQQAQSLMNRLGKIIEEGRPVPEVLRNQINRLLGGEFVDNLSRGQALYKGASDIVLVDKNGVELPIDFGVDPGEVTKVLDEINLEIAGEVGTANEVRVMTRPTFGEVLRHEGVPGKPNTEDLLDLNPKETLYKHTKEMYSGGPRGAFRRLFTRRFEMAGRVDPDFVETANEAVSSIHWGNLKGHDVYEELTKGLGSKNQRKRIGKDFLRLLYHDAVEMDLAKLEGNKIRKEIQSRIRKEQRKVKKAKDAGEDPYTGTLERLQKELKEYPTLGFEQNEAKMRKLLLSDDEYKRLLADPKIRTLLDRWKNGPQSELLALRQGLMRQIGMEMPEKEVGRLGTFVNFLSVLDPTEKARLKRLGITPRGTRFAQRRTYSADRYTSDLEEVLRGSYVHDMSRMQRNKLLQHVLRSEADGGYMVTMKARRKAMREAAKADVDAGEIGREIGGADVPTKAPKFTPQVVYKGKTLDLVEVDPQVILKSVNYGVDAVPDEVGNILKMGRGDSIWLPKDIAEALKSIANRGHHRPNKYWETLSGAMIEMQLLTPAEAAMHSFRQISILSKIPQRDAKMAITRGFGNMFPKLQSIGKVANAFDVEGRYVNEILNEIGASPTRAFHEIGRFNKMLSNVVGGVASVGGKQVRRKVRGWTKWLLEQPHRLLFGLKGMDLRTRIAATKMWIRWKKNPVTGNYYNDMFEAADEMMSNPEMRLELQEFLTGFGHYNDALTTNTVNTIRRMQMPFARTQTANIPREIHQLFGGPMPRGVVGADAARYRLESVYRGLLGEMIFRNMMNYSISGKWTWQNDPGHAMDLNLGQVRRDDGQMVDMYLASNFLDPASNRAGRIIGLSDMDTLTRYDAWTNPVERYGMGMVRNIGNQVLAALGPTVRHGLSTVSGRAPYLTRGWGLLRLRETATTPGEAALKNLGVTAAHMWPALHKVGVLTGGFDPDRRSNVSGPAETARRALPLVGGRLSFGQTEQEVAAGPIKRERGRIRKVMSEIVSETKGMDTSKLAEFFEAEIERRLSRVSPMQRAEARIEIWDMWVGSKIGTAKAAAEAKARKAKE